MQTVGIKKTNFVRNVEDLDVFKMAFSLSVEIHKVSLSFPKIEQYALADQLRRATKSICANLAEGFAKQSFSPAEFRRFIFMSLGSTEEVYIWILYCRELDYIDISTYERWRSEYKRVAKMLQKLGNTVKT